MYLNSSSHLGLPLVLLDRIIDPVLPVLLFDVRILELAHFHSSCHFSQAPGIFVGLEELMVLKF